MNNLKCTTANCEHNIRDICTAGIINVSDNAMCDTKVKREGGAVAQQFAEMEAAADMTPSQEKVYVQCDADCVFNHDHLCSADKITISDTLFSTKCASRRKG